MSPDQEACPACEGAYCLKCGGSGFILKPPAYVGGTGARTPLEMIVDRALETPRPNLYPAIPGSEWDTKPEPELTPLWPTTSEQAEVLGHFMLMLKAATGDGGAKRAAGTKPSWKVDPSHEAAMWSHINKWKHGEKTDKDSGVHPLVHLAWRALAIAFQETNADLTQEGADTQ